MSTNPFEGRALVCSFAYANGHHCRMPRKTSHPYLCTYHARKEAQAEAADQVGRDLAARFSANYLSGSNLSSALAHMMSAVAPGPPQTESRLHPGLSKPNPPPGHSPVPTRIHQRLRHHLLARRNPRSLRPTRFRPSV
jgi:hypothetical protein